MIICLADREQAEKYLCRKRKLDPVNYNENAIIKRYQQAATLPRRITRRRATVSENRRPQDILAARIEVRRCTLESATQTDYTTSFIQRNGSQNSGNNQLRFVRFHLTESNNDSHDQVQVNNTVQIAASSQNHQSSENLCEPINANILSLNDVEQRTAVITAVNNSKAGYSGKNNESYGRESPHKLISLNQSASMDSTINNNGNEQISTAANLSASTSHSVSSVSTKQAKVTQTPELHNDNVNEQDNKVNEGN